MPHSEPEIYQAFADVLATGVSVADALALMSRIPGPPSAFARALMIAQDDAALATAMLGARLATPDEAARLRAAQSREELVATLRTMALRRLTRRDRVRAVREGLTAPVVLLVLSALLDPIADAIGGGSYVGAMLRGLLLVAVVVGLATRVVPAALADPRWGPSLLGVLSRLPWTNTLVATHAESEVAIALAPYATSLDLDARAQSALANATPWARKTTGVGAMTPLPTGVALALLPAPTTSPESRLLAYAAQAATLTTARTRALARWGGYTIVFILAARSFAGLAGRMAPGMGGIGIGADERKELEEIERQIHPPIVTP
ncbi:MAG: hypothetical protein ACHREM_09275 [Polyangiales bacterium]